MTTDEPESPLAMRLPDGRRISYRCYGAESGLPVLALHGTPGSHLKYAIASTKALQLGLRLIAVDRWAYGKSEAPAKPSLARYAADVAHLADALAVDRFAVLGISGGGPYAAAVAALLEGRVSAAALVSPVGPIAGAAAASRLDLMHRITFQVLPRIPGAIPLAFSLFRGLALSAPAMSARLAAGRALASDREIMADEAFATDLGRCFAEGLAGGVRGPAIDMRIFSRPWELPLEAIRCPVRIWIGAEDRNVPLAPVQTLASAIPAAQLTQLGPHGHYWVGRNYPEVLDWIARVAR